MGNGPVRMGFLTWYLLGNVSNKGDRFVLQIPPDAHSVEFRFRDGADMKGLRKETAAIALGFGLVVLAWFWAMYDHRRRAVAPAGFPKCLPSGESFADLMRREKWPTSPTQS
jgi:hypothetical protein